MNEEDKMLAGELYNSRDKQLLNKLIRAKKLCNKYNKLDVEDIEKCNEIIRELFSKTGKEFMIMPNFYCDYGFNIEIGENFHSNHNLVILDAKLLTPSAPTDWFGVSITFTFFLDVFCVSLSAINDGSVYLQASLALSKYGCLS